MRFPRAKTTLNPNLNRKVYIGSCDDVSESELDSEEDLIFEGKQLAPSTSHRHNYCLELWKEYFMNMPS